MLARRANALRRTGYTIVSVLAVVGGTVAVGAITIAIVDPAYISRAICVQSTGETEAWAYCTREWFSAFAPIIGVLVAVWAAVLAVRQAERQRQAEDDRESQRSAKDLDNAVAAMVSLVHQKWEDFQTFMAFSGRNEESLQRLRMMMLTTVRQLDDARQSIRSNSYGLFTGSEAASRFKPLDLNISSIGRFTAQSVQKIDEVGFTPKDTADCVVFEAGIVGVYLQLLTSTLSNATDLQQKFNNVTQRTFDRHLAERELV